MLPHILLAFIVFGALFAISIIGLLRSNAEAKRLHGARPIRDFQPALPAGEVTNPPRRS